MNKLLPDLSNLGDLFRENLQEDQVAAAQTAFLKAV
jgi:hypothetical protein